LLEQVGEKQLERHAVEAEFFFDDELRIERQRQIDQPEMAMTLKISATP
jgi:hypothetical protein